MGAGGPSDSVCKSSEGGLLRDLKASIHQTAGEEEGGGKKKKTPQHASIGLSNQGERMTPKVIVGRRESNTAAPKRLSITVDWLRDDSNQLPTFFAESFHSGEL